MATTTRFALTFSIACSSAFYYGVAAAVQIDTKWYAPARNQINNLDAVSTAEGVYGFTYSSSDDTPGPCPGSDGAPSSAHNWCNMPHVRRSEYVRASAEYELKYVEVIHRHHKRTPYSSNAFPVESYQWNCDDSILHYYAQPLATSLNASRAYHQVYISPDNPFVPVGWIGTCKFPQITAEGLQDSWQHGADLYQVYHDLLGFLPSRGSAHLPPSVKYRVTNNLITSQVAGMVINGMWGITDRVPLLVQAVDVDSLEPQYRCRASDNLFDAIKSSANPQWRQHLERASPLYRALDDISGVPSDDAGFHESFDHYYDNLSARQCHAKPLPCKLVDARSSSSSSSSNSSNSSKADEDDCVRQDLADAVYRWGHWEYSHIYRDSPSSLEASVGSYGVWVAELAAQIRNVVAGKSETIYLHNVAHDGSVARLLSILQIEHMFWPGMGSELVFEVYRKTTIDLAKSPASTAPKGSATAVHVAVPLSPEQVSEPINSGYYVRVLFGGQVLFSSSPTLGLMDMLPAERLISYFDGLVGENASKIKAQCDAT